MGKLQRAGARDFLSQVDVVWNQMEDQTTLLPGTFGEGTSIKDRQRPKDRPRVE